MPTTFTTESMPRVPQLRIDPRIAGGLLCAVGLVLLTLGPLLAAALGLELLAAAFWVWGRAATDAREQVARWAWLRRPATVLWLPIAIHAALPGIEHTAVVRGTGPEELLRWIEAIAVLWAGLELLAGLPLARRYSDLPGPLLLRRPWLPVLLPAAGFIVLWRQSVHWVTVEQVRQAAVPLLLLTAVLGALRAYARRQWTTSLRWLAVMDSALGALLIAFGAVSEQASLLLWLGACGGHAALLAGELRGAVARRGVAITSLWRTAAWTALASLSFPSLVASAFGGGGLNLVYFFVVAGTTALAAWITVGRMEVAPERRTVMRADPALTLSQVLAVIVLSLGPLALTLAWWAGFEASARATVVAIAPAALGGLLALGSERGADQPFWRALSRVGRVTPRLASGTFRAVVGLERKLVAFIGGLFRGATSPLHDLHTGDAQEYLLFLVGLGVLALVLPLLQ